MTDAPPIITNEDAAIDSAFFGSHAGRTCYARAHHSGWVLVVRQIVTQREPPVMLRVWGRLERVPDNDANCLALCAAGSVHASKHTAPRARREEARRDGELFVMAALCAAALPLARISARPADQDRQTPCVTREQWLERHHYRTRAIPSAIVRR